MNFPFYIARRYLFSKKSTHAINVISGISVVGVAVATMALVVTLSVFNGFHDLVASFFTQMDPQLKVTPVKGKTVAADDSLLTRIRQLPQVEVATEVMEDQALAVYGDRQAMIQLKGVEDNFDKLTHIREVLTVNGSAAPCRPRNVKLVMKYKRALAPLELPQDTTYEQLPYADQYGKKQYLKIQQLTTADINADLNQCGLAGSPTKVKAVENIVFKAKESKVLTGSDSDINGLVQELLASHTIG